MMKKQESLQETAQKLCADVVNKAFYNYFEIRRIQESLQEQKTAQKLCADVVNKAFYDYFKIRRINDQSSCRKRLPIYPYRKDPCL
jgi:hypothetical protein